MAFGASRRILKGLLAMNVEALTQWLSEPRTALTDAVTQCVREHVRQLRSRGVSFYGYALLPGEPHDINSLVAVYNGESEIKVPKANDQYRYYKYSVDEWTHWDHEGFDAANRALAEANRHFARLHTKEEGAYEMDGFEVVHSESLLNAILQGLDTARTEGVFGGSATFLALWISDSSHEIMAKAVRRLNSASVAREFVAEFG